MESLSEEVWDLVIAGTSLPQSLLSLSLSRSDLKILHVDRNQYYGGQDAGLSIDEAENWAKQQTSTSTISHPANVSRDNGSGKLATSRSYTLSLNPQIIYASSAFLPAIVTSRLHSQLDFLAVGSWWMLKDGKLQKVPSTREDVFADGELSQRDKFRLMKFLRYVIQDEEMSAENESSIPDGVSLDEALSQTFRIPSSLQSPLAALALANEPAHSAKFHPIISRIRRHMKSMNHFGPGFAAVYPKYAGHAEISQVACRTGAVGGAVYLLGQGVVSVTEPSNGSDTIQVELTNGTTVNSKKIVGSTQDLPPDTVTFSEQDAIKTSQEVKQLNSISVVSDPLAHFFPQTSENGPIPAVAIVCIDDQLSATEGSVYLQIHSEDTEECPSGQCIIYGSVTVRDDNYESAAERLKSAVTSVLSHKVNTSPNESDTIGQEPPTTLWSMTYASHGSKQGTSLKTPFLETASGKILAFPPRSPDIAFDDSVIDSVQAVWRRIIGDQANNDEFLVFEDRHQNDE